MIRREPQVLARGFFAPDPVVVAPLLLNKVLVVGQGSGGRSGRIVEVEAYRADDPASHSYRGLTARTAVMFGPPGHLYVYRSYGLHWCANVVCGAEGEGAAVLLRAIEPLTGRPAMYAARTGIRRDVDLGSGPGKLTQALGISGADNGADLTDPGGLHLAEDGVAPPAAPGVSRRIGISVAVDVPWRWFVADSAHVSKHPGPGRPGPRRPGSSGRGPGQPRPPIEQR